MLISGCSHSSSPAKSPSTVTHVDDMIVGLDTVRRIAKADDLIPRDEDTSHRPVPSEANAPGPCRAVGHNDLTFGSNWTEFRSAGYHGVTDDVKPLGRDMINGVTQAAARYANPDAAQGAFRQLESSLQACTDLHDPNYDFALDRPAPSTLRIGAHKWSHLYRLKSAVIVSVGVVGLESADEIANSVMQIITDRIS
ncbi:sensor domain-containing protein [Mycobacterium montefiorense]|uniref:Sensor domain-containing protein n=2 Tax=Mycobacterium montefiorense TaxID=154654 RepID=A0AA37UXV0_9MYCO|nr:sensor domain-containing protein [Mycobacterium montefiorense]GKU37516.1 sensor domain-containing protein [Mycobacterium montefiorense]GKU42616.1 sensor domain-containing protein [Mycobacterium montefiorense]GKU48706.1 sensor domain-containing protein [Mycobacterium montefiorense]GKU50731.1 sensor domain-containing protein [Mycobacterium montefiorense]